MFRYLRARLLRAVPVLFGVSVLVFSMLHFLPGDPATLILGESTAASADAVDRLREQLGLNAPLYVQYWRFISRAVRGDFGTSVSTHQPVTQMILDVLPSTFQLTFAAMFTAIVLGLTLGSLAAVKQNTWVDSLSILLASLGVSMPIFWFGLILIYLFSIQLGWFPVTGRGGLNRLVLPSIALGAGATGIIARLVRSSLLEVLRQDYIQTARAKGLRDRTVVLRHGLRNALIPVVTIIGLQFGALLGGAVITETVFSRQGIGRLAVNAILRKDFPLVQGTVMLTAVTYVAVNLLVDLSYALLDPRIRYGNEKG